MSQHHGQPARYVKCGWCDKPFRIRISDLRRGRGRFCTRHCLYAAWRAFDGRYARQLADQLDKAA
jgi:hypothetical protein